jgi:bacterioferritin
MRTWSPHGSFSWEVAPGDGTEAVVRGHYYNCGYDAPNDPFVETILKQNIEGERCAIGFYKRLLESVQGKDPVTYNVVLQILQDEVAHEEDLQSLLEDLEYMLKR